MQNQQQNERQALEHEVHDTRDIHEDLELSVYEGFTELRVRVSDPAQGRVIMQQLRELAEISPLYVKFADLPWTHIRSN